MCLDPIRHTNLAINNAGLKGPILLDFPQGYYMDIKVFQKIWVDQLARKSDIEDLADRMRKFANR